MTSSEGTFLFQDLAARALAKQVEEICNEIVPMFGASSPLSLKKKLEAYPHTSWAASLCRELFSDLEEEEAYLGFVLLREFLSAASSFSLETRYQIEKSAPIGALQLFSFIKKQVRFFSTLEDIGAFATVAASNSFSIGSYIAQALEYTKEGGPIFFKSNKEDSFLLEVWDVVEWEGGYLSSYFCTDPEQKVCFLDEPRIVLFPSPIMSIQELLNLISSCGHRLQPLCIFTPYVSQEVLSTLILNQHQQLTQLCLVFLPNPKEEKEIWLEEIERIVVTDKKTFFWGKAAKQEKVTRGVLLHVPQKERSQVAKALALSLSAYKEGMVRRGGLDLWHAAEELARQKEKQLKEEDSLSPSQLLVMEMLIEACQAPIAQFLANQGVDSEMLLKTVRSYRGEKSIDLLTCEIIPRDSEGDSQGDLTLYRPYCEVEKAFNKALETANEIWHCGGFLSFKVEREK